jgi:hypothetical protein
LGVSRHPILDTKQISIVWSKNHPLLVLFVFVSLFKAKKIVFYFYFFVILRILDFKSEKNKMLSSPKLTFTLVLAFLSMHEYSSELSLYSQCGGIGYTGLTQCPAGSFCKIVSQWWSQCSPGSGPIQPTTAKPPPPPPVPTTSQASPDKLVPLWGQCGGIGYTGATQCVSGAYCLRQSDWYSQCQPSGGDKTPINAPTTGSNAVVDSSTSSSSGAIVTLGPNDVVAGYYWLSWTPNSKPPSGINMGVCFR